MTDYAHVHAGSCDCGAVNFEYHCHAALSEQTARACQCEFCKPRDATYLSATNAELHVFLRDSRYLYAHRFGTNTADFMHCAVCNAGVFIRMNFNEQTYGVVFAPALSDFHNITLFADADYAGEALAERLRADHWIPTLVIHENSEHQSGSI